MGRLLFLPGGRCFGCSFLACSSAVFCLFCFQMIPGTKETRQEFSSEERTNVVCLPDG